MIVLGAIQDLSKTGQLTELWSDADVDGIAFTVPVDRLEKSFFDDAKTVRDRDMRVLLHPIEFGKSLYTPSDPASHSFILDRLALAMDAIKNFDFEPVLIIHPPRLAAPDFLVCGKKEVDEKTALANSLPFFDKLSRIAAQSSIEIAIECMHDPYANPGHSMYGYTVQQLEAICNGRDFGVCIDTGHAKLSRTSVSEYLNSQLNILTVHLQGNDGSFDQHQLPNMNNMGDVAGVLRLLTLDIPIILEANSYNLLEKASLSRSQAVEEASAAVQAVREKRLPSA